MFQKPTPQSFRQPGLSRDPATSATSSSAANPAAAKPSALAGDAAATPAPPSTPSKPVASVDIGVSDARLIIGPNVKLKGAEILDCDTLVVEGRVEATMDSRVIRIAEKGAFSGKVSIDVAEIWGQFDGELTARNQLLVHTTGKVNGKIRYGKLLIEEGGEICGEVRSLVAEPAERSGSSEHVSTASEGAKLVKPVAAAG
jgi:cytoskeletal protein CcmA (bactofilin family)